ncbi:hypothetical protein JL722_12396 [Aureococcus anophagefferens]|nr:hypothetical protein JL722_12396 [Aureococcus anophagefferens]
MRVARLLLATWCTIRAKKQRPRDACEAALGVLAWRNPGIMDDWLGDGAGTAHARAWAAWRASRGRAAFDAGDAAAAYARDVAAGSATRRRSPSPRARGGAAGPAVAAVALRRVEDNRTAPAFAPRPRPISLGFWAPFCGAFAADYACLGYETPRECAGGVVDGAHGLPAAARDAPASRAEAEALLEAYRRGPVGTFARATYFCPLKAGNGVFGFLNAFALAVVTNRTLVARFASPPDFAGNSEAACGAALRLRRWTAEAHILATPGLDELPATFVDFGVMYGHNAAAAAMPEAARCLGPPARAAALFRGGLDLAYGVLFHAAFELARPVPVDADAGFSVALHSRHRGGRGADASREAAASRASSRARRPCVVRIMSDRAATRANADFAEHGPSRAFFADLAVAAAATDGLVATVSSTASNLVAALVAHGHSRRARAAPLARCLLTYGPARPWYLPYAGDAPRRPGDAPTRPGDAPRRRLAGAERCVTVVAATRNTTPPDTDAAGCAVVRVAHFDGLLASVDRYDGKYGRFSGEVPFSAADWAAALALDGDGSRLDAWARLARGVERCDADARGAFDVVVFGGSVTGGRSCWNPTFPFDEGANCSAWHRFEAWLRWRYPRCPGLRVVNRFEGSTTTAWRVVNWADVADAVARAAMVVVDFSVNDDGDGAVYAEARDATESLARLVLSEGAVLVVFVAMRKLADVDDGYQAEVVAPNARYYGFLVVSYRDALGGAAPLPPRNFTARLGAAVAACGGRYLSDFAAADLAAAGPAWRLVANGSKSGVEAAAGAAGSRLRDAARRLSLEVRLGPRPALLVTALASYETFADGVFWLDDDVAAAEAALAATEALEDFCAPKPCGPREACAEKLPECAAFAAGLSPAPHVVRGAWRDRSTMPRTSVFFERAELAPPTRRVPVRTFVLRPGSRFAAPGTHALHVVPRPPRSPASPPAKFRLLRVRSC